MFIDILIILIILFSFIVILLNNTVYSILSLILVFFLSSILLLSYGLDYLSLIFITIYVGALSVLFLFFIKSDNKLVGSGYNISSPFVSEERLIAGAQ